MHEIAKAINAKIGGDTNLQLGLTGEWWNRHAPQGRAMPYAVFKVGDGEIAYDTSRRYVEPVTVEVNIVGRYEADVAPIVARWRAGFIYQPLTLDTGHVMALALTSEQFMDESPETESRASVHHRFNFEITQQQSHA